MLMLSMRLAANPTTLEATAARMKAYQAKEYGEAVTQFRRAIELGEAPAVAKGWKDVAQRNRTLAPAHFNLACTLALARKAGKVCEHDAYRSRIVEEVGRSIALDPNRLEKALTDPDLGTVRDTLAFQGAKDLSPTRESDVAALLSAVRRWNPGEGVTARPRHDRNLASGDSFLSGT